MTNGSTLYASLQCLEEEVQCELIVPFGGWPKLLNSRYGRFVRFLAAASDGDERLVEPPRVEFCHDVKACPNKPNSSDHPPCPRNQLGVCCDATYEHNAVAIPGRALAPILGFSSARVHQIQIEGVAKLRRLMMADLQMVEMCQDWSVGGEMPSWQAIERELA